MNIKFTKKLVTSQVGDVLSVDAGTLELCSMGSNRGEGDQVVPIKLGNAVIAPLITVKSATTRNKRGTTSAVLKVSMPYTAFGAKKSYVNGSSGSQVLTSNLVQDPSRSGGEVSAHIVIALPSAMTTDLNRTDDGTGDAKLMREAAYQQFSALVTLLAQLAGPHLMPGAPIVSESSPGGSSTNRIFNADPSATGFSVHVLKPDPVAGMQDAIAEETTGQSFLDTHITGTDGTDYGVGLNAAHVVAPVLLHNALGRIVRGQPALACDDIAPQARIVA